MDVTLVIPAHNEGSAIGPCLDSAIISGRGRWKEIIVVDNASTDDTTREALKRHGVKVVHEARKGTGHARQTGLEHAHTEYVAFVDADTHMPHDWLDKAERIMQERPDCVLLSGPYRYDDTTWFRKIFLDGSWLVVSPIVYRCVGYMALGGNLFLHRKALISVGGFNRKIAFYGDDTDLSKQMSRVGKVLFRMDFYIYSSARRFDALGIVRTNVLYIMNYMWPVIFGRPYTLTADDVREV